MKAIAFSAYINWIIQDHQEVLIFTDSGIYCIIYEFDSFYGKESFSAYKLKKDKYDYNELVKQWSNSLSSIWSFFQYKWTNYTKSDYEDMWDGSDEDKKYFIDTIMKLTVVDDEHLDLPKN